MAPIAFLSIAVFVVHVCASSEDVLWEGTVADCQGTDLDPIVISVAPDERASIALPTGESWTIGDTDTFACSWEVHVVPPNGVSVVYYQARH